MLSREVLCILEIQAYGYGPEGFLANAVTLAVELDHEIAEAREYGVGKPLVRLAGVIFAADVVDFLASLSN
jgi:hypothetical protein